MLPAGGWREHQLHRRTQSDHGGQPELPPRLQASERRRGGHYQRVRVEQASLMPTRRMRRRVNVAPAISAVSYDPAILALDGWWRAPYADPWTPTASAGASGSNGNLTSSGSPATGS